MIDTLKPLIKQFLPFAQERMGFEHPPRLFVRQDADNAANPLGKTAYYDPGASSVTLYVTDRHPKDVMRSLSHELVHHTQHCNGELENAGEMGEGYAQNNPHMREMERQAYEIGNLCFRDWEDSIKGTIYNEHLQKGVGNIMSTKDWKNGEMNSLLLEKWGFKFDPKGLAEERTGSGVGHGPGDDDPDVGERESEGEELSKRELNEDEEELEEAEGSKKGEYKRRDKKGKVGHRAGDVGGHYKDFEGPYGGGKDEESAEDPGEEDYTWRKGKKSKTHGGLNKESLLREDSGEEEAWHDWKNEHADDDHIREIEHHLRALKDDRDHERHDAEYDHDKYEDEGDPDLEERRMRGRKGPHTRGVPHPALREEQVRELVRSALKRVMEKKNG